MAGLGGSVRDSNGATSRRWSRHVIGAAISVACVVVFLNQLDIRELVASLDSFQWKYLVFGIGSLGLGYTLRIYRWSVILNASDAGVGFRACRAPFLGSVALNNVLPLRLGDLVRAFVFPKSMGIRRTTATGSLIVERLLDLTTLLLSLGIGLAAINAVSVPPSLVASAIALAVLTGAGLVGALLFSLPLSRLLSEHGALHRQGGIITSVARAAATLLSDVNAMSRPRVLGLTLAMSLLVWVGEAGLFYSVLLGVGVDNAPVVALLVMAMATLSTLVPAAPGYVGPFHLAAFTAISLAGGSVAQAGSYAVIAHLALWLPTTAAGALAIWGAPELYQAAKRHEAHA